MGVSVSVDDLFNEAHARPSLYFEAPALMFHVAYRGGDGAWATLPAIFENLTQLRISADERHASGRLGLIHVKWERHTEFATLTAVVPVADMPEDMPESLTRVPGERFVQMQLCVIDAADPRAADPPASFDLHEAAASTVGGGDATVWADFRLRPAGFSRAVLVNRNLNAFRVGRMARRLCEIETYRMMALFGLPLARSAGERLVDFDERLSQIARRNAVATTAGGESDRALFDELSQLSADVVSTLAATRHRFGATGAYAELVAERIAQLRETHVAGYQRFGIFVDRRFRPAVRTCASTAHRLERLAASVAQLGSLLQTRVQLALEDQNALRLEGMERRARSQLRIQSAVEGLSVIAIGYYAVSLIKSSLEAADHAGIEVPHYLPLVAIPATLAIVGLALWRVRRALRHDEG